MDGIFVFESVRLEGNAELYIIAGSVFETTDLGVSQSGRLSNYGDTVIDNLTLNTGTLTNNGNMTLTTVNVDPGTSVLSSPGQLNAIESLTIQSEGVLTHSTGGPGLALTVTGDLTIEAGGSINVDAQGYGSKSGPGGGTDVLSGSTYYGSGAGYGGLGGKNSRGTTGGVGYGSITQPTELGSGGGVSSGSGGAGGGAVRLMVGGTLSVDGQISANGGNSPNTSRRKGGGGSGGSIYITTSVLAGAGAISADGGNGVSTSGGGGGGRIAVYHDTNTYTGGMSALGGTGYEAGGAGTIYQKSDAQANGDLLVDNGGNSGASTPIDANLTLDSLSVVDEAQVYITPGTTITSFVTFLSTGVIEIVSGASLYSRDLHLNSISTIANGDGEAVQGNIQVDGLSTIQISGSVRLDDINALVSLPTSSISIGGDLIGDTLNSDRFAPQGIVLLNGSGTSEAPQLLEAMGQDLGIDPDGFDQNFVYGTLALSDGTYVKLSDLSENSPGSQPEAVYVNALIVPSGTTLDLSGLNLYARLTQIAGTVLGGSVIQIPDSGTIPSAGVQTVGSISGSGELDEWTFFARGGVTVAIEVMTREGVLIPHLGYAQVELLDPDDNILASASSFGETLVLTDIQIPADAEYRIHIRAAADYLAGTGNYSVTWWDMTPDIGTLQLNRQHAGAIENAYSVDRWIFSAAADAQIRLDLVSADLYRIAFDLEGPNGWSGFSGIAGDSELITLPESGTYTLIAKAAAAQAAGAYSFVLEQTQVTDIDLGVAYHGTYAGPEHALLFRFDLPESSPLAVVLTGDTGSASAVELYLKHDSPPTPSDFGYRYERLSFRDQKITVPVAYQGTWYALVYGDTVLTGEPFTILAQASDLLLTDFTPDHHGNSADTVLSITGAGFDSTTQVELVALDGTRYLADGIERDSDSRMTAMFLAETVPAGSYTLLLSNAGGSSAQIDNAFEMVNGGTSTLEANLVVPSSIGARAPATIWIEYSNTGDVAMPAPLLVLTGSNDALLTMDGNSLVSGFWTSAEPARYSATIQFLAAGETPGVLQPSESVRVPVYYAGSTALNSVQFNLGSISAVNSTLANWASLKDDLRPDTIETDAWDAIWSNFVAEVGTTWGDYVSMLSENAGYLSRLGVTANDVSNLLAFEFAQANSLHVVNTLASSTDAYVGASGLDLAFTRNFDQSIISRYAVGDLGRGWSHNWNYSTSVEPDGTVTILGPGGSRRVFQPDSRNSNYFSSAGDTGVLSGLGSGAFLLTEAGGGQFAFNEDSTLDYVQDTNGSRITAVYDSDLLISLIHTSGQSLVFTHDTSGLIETITDPDGRITAYTYDGIGEHLVSVEYFDGSTISYDYSLGESIQKEHALTEITYPGGTHQFFEYDARGRLASSSGDEGAERTSFTFDSTGRVFAKDAFNQTTTFYFDHRGLPGKTVNPLGDIVQFDYDYNFNLISVSDPHGLENTYEYDSIGNLVDWTNTLGHSTRFKYDGPFNRMTQIVDTNGNPMEYSYDTAGNLTSITYSDGSVERWTYDSSGNTDTSTNRRGQTIDYAYDTDGQLLRKLFSDSDSSDFVYDDRGNLISATNETGTITMGYYQLGELPNGQHTDRLKRITYPEGQWLEYTYNDSGQRGSMLDQLGHRLDYHYDAVGRLASITDETSESIVLYEYDAAGRLERKTLGNDVFTTYTYDVASQLIGLHNRQPDGSTLSRFEYAYDSRGRRISMTTSYAAGDPRTAAGYEGTWTYGYDDIGQLTGFTDPTGHHVEYVYDAMGNRLQVIADGVATDYTVNELNQYTQVAGTAYTFDLDGNLIRTEGPEGNTSYTFDEENRLVAVDSPGGLMTYTDDALGQRYFVDRFGEESLLVTDPFGFGNLVGEYDPGTGEIIQRHDYGFGLISSYDVAGVSSYFTFDAVGNTADLTDRIGLSDSQYLYEPFGQVNTFGLPDSTRFLFTGEFGVVNEGNGLEFMRARYYSAELGRFTQPDPIGTNSGDTNLQRYVFNSPTSAIDPLGLHEKRRSRHETTQHRGAVSTKEGLWIAVELGITYFLPYYRIVTVLKSVKAVWAVRAVGAVGTVTGAMGFSPYPESLDPGLLPEDFIPETEGLPTGYDGMLGNLPPPPTDNLANAVITILRARDPNEKTAPAGYGEGHYIAAGDLLSYRVEFENLESATAPAQLVEVTDQLDPNLDWSTFELTEIGFADTIIAIPDNTQHFETSVPMTQNGVDFEVQIAAGINLATGEVSATFSSIVPGTGLPPSVLAGFLPPEDGTGRGQGYFSYIINHVAGLTTGTEIRNIALISFDRQQSIATNQVDPLDPTRGTDPEKEAFNTIDAGPPDSQVDLLPGTIYQTNFALSWSGEDDLGGSGVASYDIHVSEDGGNFNIWLADTTETSAIYSGEIGHSYAFYSRARDNVGNQELEPVLADAETTVSLNVAPAVSLDVFEQTIQYSDPIGDVTITATDLLTDVMNASVAYTGPIPPGSGLPDAGTIAGGLQLTGNLNQVGTGTWTVQGIADLAPGTYVLTITVYDEDGGSVDVDTTLNVLQEDAAITYTGPAFVSTPSVKDSKATVELRAVIQGITTVDPASDPNAGDITTATVTFVDRDTGAILAADIPVELLGGDPTTGIVSYQHEFDIGNSDSETYTIGVIVGGHYLRNSASDNTLVTVAKPLENSVTGGGFITNVNSAGLFGGDLDLKTNFGFNIKFNKKLTNIQGHINVIIRQAGRVYQIKSNALTSLSVNTLTGEATILAKANLTDITDPNNAISLGGNLSLIITLSDGAISGGDDYIGITLWKKNELWYSSNWLGVNTEEQVLAGGNLAIR